MIPDESFGILSWAFLFGSLIGLTGIGLGSIGTAGLVMFLNISPIMAVGTNTVNGFLIKSLGAYRHYRYSHVETSLAKNLLLGAIPAEVIGVLLGHFASTQVFKRVLGISLLVVAAALLLDLLWTSSYAASATDERFTKRGRAASMATGALVGLMVGITSSGSGTLFSAIFLLLYRCVPQLAVGTTVFTANLLLLSAAVLHFLLGHVDAKLLLLLIAGSAPGVALGAFLCKHAPHRFLKMAIGLLIFAAGLKLLI